MKIIILGSGTSTGVPVIGCQCTVCLSNDPRDNRLRSSVAFSEIGTDWTIIDTTPDFRQQVLYHKITAIDSVLYTHIHADHCHGFDDLRAYSFASNKKHLCYLLPQYIPEFKTRFSYAFMDTGYGGSKPNVELVPIPNSTFKLGNLFIEPIILPHGVFATCGFKINNFAYLTDFKGFPQDTIPLWRDKIHTMVCSGIHFGKHRTHNTIPETIQLFQDLNITRGIITHLSHEVHHTVDSERLPKGVEFAFDGMILDV